jgi:methyl-accepting chemotaxis protein
MNWFKNLSTVAKLVLAFCLMCLLMGVVGYQGVSAAGDLNTMIGALYEKQVLGIAEFKEASLYHAKIGREIRTAMGTSDRAQREQLSQKIDQYFSLMNEQLDKGEKTITTEVGKEQAAKLRGVLPQYESMIREANRQLIAGNDKEAVAATISGAALVEQTERAFSDLCSLKEQIAQRTFDQSAALYSRVRTTLISILVFAVLFALGVGYFIAKLISKPLLEAVGVLQKIAGGDLTARLDVDTKDEVGQMAESLNQAAEAMCVVLGEMRESAQSMANSSQELASASEELSSGAQEQASSLEEITSTVEQAASSIKQNADNAKQANQVSSGAREVADKGGQVLSAAVSAMGEINESSKNIAEIITTIDEIAFQTNLLALNAAVEAARAGEQGRGFAVVATEVRNLAQRAASSAKEIKRLIQDSVRKVENGSKLVNESGETLQEILGSAKKTTDLVAEIAAASREQSLGVEQINKAMIQLDQVTQANSSQTEELSATAQSLSAHALQLQSLAERFRVDAGNSRQFLAAVSAPAVAAKPAAVAVAQPRRKPQPGPRMKPSMALDATPPPPAKIKPNGHDTTDVGFEEF